MSNNGLPQDVDNAWLNVIRATVAECSGNRGFAVVNLKVVVNGNIPMLWMVDADKIHPASFARLHMSPGVASALTATIK